MFQFCKQNFLYNLRLVVIKQKFSVMAIWGFSSSMSETSMYVHVQDTENNKGASIYTVTDMVRKMVLA